MQEEPPKIIQRKYSKKVAKSQKAKTPKGTKLEGFRDLMHYANFQNELDDVSEKENEDSGGSPRSGYEYESSYKTYSQSAARQGTHVSDQRKGFYVPDPDEEEPETKRSKTGAKTGISYYSNKPNQSIVSTSTKSRVRRYGRRKNEREQALR